MKEADQEQEAREKNKNRKQRNKKAGFWEALRGQVEPAGTCD